MHITMNMGSFTVQTVVHLKKGEFPKDLQKNHERNKG